MSISCLSSVVSELAKVLNCFNAREIYLRWRTSFNCFNKRNCIYQCLSSSSRQRVVVEVWHLSQENGLHCSHASKCIGCCLHHVISASMGLAPSCVERGATLCWHSRKVALDGGSSLLSLIRVTQIVTPLPPSPLISFVVAVKRNYIVIRLIASTFCLKLSVLEGGNHIMQIFKGLEGMHSKFLSREDLLIFNTV